MAVWSTVDVSELGHAQRIEADYYRPQYLEVAARLEAVKSVPLTRHLGYLTDGTHVTPKYVPHGVPFLSSSDIDPFLISPVIEKFISEAEHLRLRHCQPDAGDILMSKSGRIGSCAVVPASVKKGDWNIYEGVALLRVDDVEPHYVAAFLNSKYGHSQIRRELKGVAQPHLHLEDIRRLRLFVPEPTQMADISALVIGGMERAKCAHQLFQEAHAAVEAELGLHKLTFQKSVGYVTSFSDLEASCRSDAEFFHTRYAPFLTAATNYQRGWQPLKNLTTQTLQNFDSRKASGDVSYIEIGDISISDGSYTTSRVAVKDLPANARIELSGGEILVSQVRPTRGAIAIIDDELPSKTVCSGAFYVCSANQVSHREVIWLYLRCMRSVFEKYCGGTSYPTIDSQYVGRFPVPLFDAGLANEVQDLVVQAKSALRESERLLERAKARVEQLIEEETRP